MNESISYTKNDLPLSGYTVVDLTQVLAGPFASMNLGDLGAEVIKIEAVGRGDRARGVSPKPEYFNTTNRNKRSIELDLKSGRGQDIAKSLIEEADVFIQSMKPGRIETFNLDFESIVEINPSIIYCTVTGFGEGSPYENVPAFDLIIQAMSGIMSMTGSDDTPPLWSGLPSGDLIASMYATQSILSALIARESGKIPHEKIEVPMLDTAISWLSVRAGYSFGYDSPFPRLGTEHPSASPFGVFECKDGSIVIASPTDSLWKKFCQALDREDLLNKSRFESIDKRAEHSDLLREEIRTDLESTTEDELIGKLHDNGVPAGPIYDTMTVWEDDHVKKRGLRRSMEDEDGKKSEMIDHPVKFLNLDPEFRFSPPNQGNATQDILKENGFTEEEIEELRDNEIIGT